MASIPDCDGSRNEARLATRYEVDGYSHTYRLCLGSALINWQSREKASVNA